MYFNKTQGQVVPTGSLEFFFDRKAIFEFAKPANMDLEELELELIDAGLEEIEEEEGLVLAYANYTDFGNMNQKFEELGIELTKAELKRIAIGFEVGETITSHDPKHLAEKINIVLNNGKAFYKDNLDKAANELCWENEENKLKKYGELVFYFGIIFSCLYFNVLIEDIIDSSTFCKIFSVAKITSSISFVTLF